MEMAKKKKKKARIFEELQNVNLTKIWSVKEFLKVIVLYTVKLTQF